MQIIIKDSEHIEKKRNERKRTNWSPKLPLLKQKVVQEQLSGPPAELVEGNTRRCSECGSKNGSNSIASSLGGDLSKFGLSVCQSNVELSGAFDDGKSRRKNSDYQRRENR